MIINAIKLFFASNRIQTWRDDVDGQCKYGGDQGFFNQNKLFWWDMTEINFVIGITNIIYIITFIEPDQH